MSRPTYPCFIPIPIDRMKLWYEPVMSDGFGVKMYTFLPNSAGTSCRTQLTATLPAAFLLTSIVVASLLQGIAKPLLPQPRSSPVLTNPALAISWAFKGMQCTWELLVYCSEQVSCMCQVLWLDIVVLCVTVDSRCFGQLALSAAMQWGPCPLITVCLSSNHECIPKSP